MIKLTSFSAVQVYDLSYLHLQFTNSRCDQLPDGSVDSSVGRALHRYRRGHGFESHLGLNFFQALILQLLSCVYNCDNQSQIRIRSFRSFRVPVCCCGQRNCKELLLTVVVEVCYSLHGSNKGDSAPLFLCRSNYKDVQR